jgi:hypothetical protein
MKVIFAGGRTFINKNIALKILQDCYKADFIPMADKIVGISGQAKGADTTFANVISSSGGKVLEYPAKWNDLWGSKENPVQLATNKLGKYNRIAGFNRNRLMSEIGEKLVVAWNGSAGTNHMIELMVKLNKPVRIYNYEGDLVYVFKADEIQENTLKMISVLKSQLYIKSP